MDTEILGKENGGREEHRVKAGSFGLRHSAVSNQHSAHETFSRGFCAPELQPKAKPSTQKHQELTTEGTEKNRGHRERARFATTKDTT